jgi:outer membrane cobalamin receptor
MMNIRYFFWVCVLICSSLAVSGQPVTIKGLVTASDNEPVAGASVSLLNLGRTVVTDEQGRFVFTQVTENLLIIQITAAGYEKLTTEIDLNEGEQLFSFRLQRTAANMETVTVLGYTPVQLRNRQAYNVTAIDAVKFHNTTLDIATLLNRVPGARLRESGGTGSDFDFSLNGFSGKRVRFFMDGVPIDELGPAFQINNIPVNFAERIEIYKGVVPVWLGSDALGGAINIITGTKLQNFLDVSYAYGSFNTHRSSINAAITSNKGFTFRVNAFQNYSDNNYEVVVDAADIYTGEYFPDSRVKRFHDKYHNETIIAKLGVVNKKWADQLLMGVTLGQYYKEIQTGARLTAVFGHIHNRGNILMPTLTYNKKNLLTRGLDLSFNANYNFGEEQSVDTVHARYNWLQDSVNYRGKGGERSYMWYKYKNNMGSIAASASYRLGDNHFFALNNVLSLFNRKGTNIVSPHAMLDNIPLQSNKNVLGLSYQFKKNDRADLSVFGKYLQQNAHTRLVETDYTRPNDTTYNNVSKKIHKYGYGFAGSYFLQPGLQLKLSFENTNRLPESEDLFGDATNKDGNWNLKPESSKNINLGVGYTYAFRENRFYFSVTGIYSYVNDYIYYVFNSYTNKMYAENILSVSNLGLESEIRFSHKNILSAGVNVTYQNLRDRERYRFDLGGEIPSNTYKQRIPNIPYLFGNADANIFFNNVFTGSDKLSIGYNLLYVHDFYLYWASEGASSTKRIIPEQVAHDINMIYTLKEGKYNIAFECKNITDRILYDNYSLQKPGRSVNVKLRYFINR